MSSSPRKGWSVKVLMQHNDSFHYYRGDGDWTTERSHSENFGNTLGALKVIQQDTLKHVSILLTFEHSRADLRLLVGDGAPAYAHTTESN